MSDVKNLIFAVVSVLLTFLYILLCTELDIEWRLSKQWINKNETREKFV